jgi:transcriptional regulator with XRE-family HTH domain
MAQPLLTIGGRLQIFRKAHLGLTQANFAKAMDTTQANISQIEKDHCTPSGNFIKQLIDRYDDINLNWLFYGQDQMLRSKLSAAESLERTEVIERLEREIAGLKVDNSTLMSTVRKLLDTQQPKDANGG